MKVAMFRFSTSRLYNQNSFYDAFLHDLRHAKSRIIIESPFITEKRVSILLPTLQYLRKRNVRVVVNTKPFEEREVGYREQTIWAVGMMQDLGIEILFTNGHHRKIAIVDEDILYEGSLNILSQNDSCELMRRMKSKALVKEMLKFTKLKKWTR